MARLKRLYAPYIKQGKRWIRATYTTTNEGVQTVNEFRGYTKETAIRVYQNWLLAPFLQGIEETRELRPIPVKSKDYDGIDWYRR